MNSEDIDEPEVAWVKVHDPQPVDEGISVCFRSDDPREERP